LIRGFKGAPVTAILLILIFAVFAVEWLAGVRESTPDFARVEILYRLGAIVPTMFADHEYWRAITGMFLHANLLHLATNTSSLWQLGTLYEKMFGSRRFTLIYFTTGIIASCASALFTRGVGVGASGAVLGILGAFIFSILRSPRWRHERWTRGLIAQLLFFAVLNLLLPMRVKNIDSVAHVAGLLSGLLLGFIPHRVPPPPPGEAIIDARPQQS